MSRPPPGIFGCVAINARCGQCGQRPVAIASLPTSDATQMDLMWACDDHVAHLAAIIRRQGADPNRHMFEISRTCRAGAGHGALCGAAGDYLAVFGGGDAVITICRRHMEEWRPDTATEGAV